VQGTAVSEIEQVIEQVIEQANESQTIAVRTEFDILVARRQARKMAQAIGLDITSQARIALATSSLGRTLRLGETFQGQVNIDCLSGGERAGIRVICTAVDGANSDLTSRTFADTRRLVDELTVEELPPNDLQVNMIKWIPPSNFLKASRSEERSVAGD
jgi:hypothetical protein